MKQKAPQGLSAEARRMWNAIVSAYEMDEAGLIVLKEGCLALDRLREAQDILRKEGITVTDRFGVTRGHPCILIERDTRNALFKALAALHLDFEPDTGPGAPIGRI